MNAINAGVNGGPVQLCMSADDVPAWSASLVCERQIRESPGARAVLRGSADCDAAAMSARPRSHAIQTRARPVSCTQIGIRLSARRLAGCPGERNRAWPTVCFKDQIVKFALSRRQGKGRVHIQFVEDDLRATLLLIKSKLRRKN